MVAINNHLLMKDLGPLVVDSGPDRTDQGHKRPSAVATQLRRYHWMAMVVQRRQAVFRGRWGYESENFSEF